MADIYLKQGAKYYIRFRISTVNVDQSKPGVKNPDIPWMIEEILPPLSNKWYGTAHVTKPNHFPPELQKVIYNTQPAGAKLQSEWDRTFWLEAEWKLESGTYCADAVLSTRYVTGSEHDGKDGRDYKNLSITAKFHDYAPEPEPQQQADQGGGTQWIGDKGNEKIEVDLPLNIPKGSIPLPGGKTITMPGTSRTMPNTKPPSQTVDVSKKPPSQTIDATGSKKVEPRPVLERVPESDSPPLGDDFNAENVLWSESGIDESQMQNEPKDEESSNTALWVGLGAVGVGALIWWASTKK